MNRYQVRISVIRMETAPSLAGVVGGRVPDKLLDASFTTDDLHEIRDCVDGLIREGIPETQHLKARLKGLMDGSGGLPPTVAESGDVDLAHLDRMVWKTTGHSPDCQCVDCRGDAHEPVSRTDIRGPLMGDGSDATPVDDDHDDDATS